MLPSVSIADFIAGFRNALFTTWHHLPPWELTKQSTTVVRSLLGTLSPSEYFIADEIAVHRSATVESGSVLKGPIIVGAKGFIAAGAYLRGGIWLAEQCIIGPGAELKSAFVFSGTKLAHFNFVGDSILGDDVNLEAGSIVCNYRNERPSKEIRVRVGATVYGTGVEKFGSLIGDGSRIGANAVVAPGALLRRGTVVGRGISIDQETLA
jgi:UDP-N-acetylglucosamine diphosphorylase / glucose-1-phosphate thymidylyltransferase / UDP-N-acetylgalactosamine diphosphorylase / glucosamine-1-phosphate N-acetyltransferase / galactosamine-1-phosphate N-acetyltransferase